MYAADRIRELQAVFNSELPCKVELQRLVHVIGDSIPGVMNADKEENKRRSSNDKRSGSRVGEICKRTAVLIGSNEKDSVFFSVSGGLRLRKTSVWALPLVLISKPAEPRRSPMPRGAGHMKRSRTCAPLLARICIRERSPSRTRTKSRIVGSGSFSI